jgi:hypothetical protein
VTDLEHLLLEVPDYGGDLREFLTRCGA